MYSVVTLRQKLRFNWIVSAGKNFSSIDVLITHNEINLFFFFVDFLFISKHLFKKNNFF